MRSLYHYLVETTIKNVHHNVCQIYMKLFKMYGHFVEVHDEDDKAPGMRKGKCKGKSLRHNNLKPKPKALRRWTMGSDSWLPCE